MPGLAPEKTLSRQLRSAAVQMGDWSAHARANRGRVKSWVQTLWMDHNNKTGVLISAGPSLQDSLNEIEELDRATHELVAVDMALDFLLKNGIKPDYVICSDASEKISPTLEVPGIPEDIALLLNVIVNPKTGANWKGPVYWYTMASNIFDLDLGRWMERDHMSGAKVPCSLVPGGNVSSLGLSFLLGVRAVPKVLLYGHDFCWTEDDRFYCGGVRGDLAKERIQSEGKAGTIFPMKDTYGKPVKTNGTMLEFARWFHKRMNEYPGVIENRTPITILQGGK